MTKKDARLTIRLGELAKPLAALCRSRGIKQAEAARIAIAKLCGVSPPEMTVGNPDIARHASEGGRAKKRCAQK